MRRYDLGIAALVISIGAIVNGLRGWLRYEYEDV